MNSVHVEYKKLFEYSSSKVKSAYKAVNILENPD